MRGRKPKPTKTKELTGAFIKDPQRRNKNEPKASTEVPRKPPMLAGYAADEWDRLSGILGDMSMLSESDIAAMELYCHTYGEWRNACDQVKKYGSVFVHKVNGQLHTKRNPFDIVRERNATMCVKLLIEFGLTPSSRSRVSVREAEEDDPFTAYLKTRMSDN